MAVPAHDTRDWSSPRSSACPSSRWSRATPPSNLDEAAFTDVATGTLVNSASWQPVVTDAKEDDRLAGGDRQGRDKVNYKLRDWVFSRRVTGATHPHGALRQVWLAAPAREQPAPDPCRTSPTLSRARTASPRWPATGLGQDHLPLLRRPRNPRRPTPCPSGLVLPGTSLPIWTPTARTPLPPRRPGILVSGGLVQRRHGAHPCTCCTAVSGISSCTTSAQCLLRNRTEAYRSRYDPGLNPTALSTCPLRSRTSC